jgi:hypothetical protein
MAVFMALIAVGIAILVLVLRDQMSHVPSRIARKRLDAKIAALRGKLAALQPSDVEYVPHVEAVLRHQWLREQMKSRTVDSLEVPGFGDALLETLREHDIRSLQDVELMRYRKIPGVGEKRAAQLWSAYKDESAKLERQAQTMSASDLDRVSGGKLRASIDRHAAEELQRVRELELAQLQLVEAERRRSQIN